MTPARLYAAAGAAIAVFLVAWFASGWVWVIILAAAIGAGPWFACSRLLDRIGELEAELDRRPDPDAAPVPRIYPEPPTLPMAHIAAAKPELYIVEPASDDLPLADESWLDEDGRFLP